MSDTRGAVEFQWRAFDDELFVICPIGAAGTETRMRSDRVLEYVVKPAAAELGLKPLRSDVISQAGDINPQIVERLAGSKAVVADLTDGNPNVFYELAIRQVVRKPVVLVAQDETKIPFDLRTYRVIFFNASDPGSNQACASGIVEQLRHAFDNPESTYSPLQREADRQMLGAGGALGRGIASLEALVGSVGAETVAIRERLGLDGPTDLVAPQPSFWKDTRMADMLYRQTEEIAQTVARMDGVDQRLLDLVEGSAMTAARLARRLDHFNQRQMVLGRGQVIPRDSALWEVDPPPVPEDQERPMRDFPFEDLRS